MRPRDRRIPLTVRWSGALLLVLAVVSVVLPMRRAPTVTKAQDILAVCEQEMHLTVTNFGGAPNGVYGTIDSPLCVVPTQPLITHAKVFVNGSATGTPNDITITERDDVIWLNAQGNAVATSTLTLTRTIIGLPPIATLTVPVMAVVALGAVGNGLLIGQKVNLTAGLALRSKYGNVWVYTNEDAGGYQDYG